MAIEIPQYIFTRESDLHGNNGLFVIPILGASALRFKTDREAHTLSHLEVDELILALLRWRAEHAVASRDLQAAQDDCIIAISDRRSPPDATLRRLPPWRAVMVARIADAAGVPLEKGTLDELTAEAARVTGAGRLAPSYEG